MKYRKTIGKPLEIEGNIRITDSWKNVFSLSGFLRRKPTTGDHLAG